MKKTDDNRKGSAYTASVMNIPDQTGFTVPPTLPMWRKICFALGQLGWSLGSYGVLNLINYFYNPPTATGGGRLFPLYIGSAAALGIVTAGGRLFDGITDPLLAGLSDRSRSRFGRRRSFMAVGAIPFAVLGVLVFVPPSDGTGALNIAWLFVMSFLFYLFMTMYVTPYFALMSELGHSPEERLQLSTMISITWALGFMLGSQVYLLQDIFEAFAAPEQALQMSLSVFAAVSLILMLLPILLIDERKYCENRVNSEPLLASLRTALANRNFRYFVLSDLSYWLAITFVQTGISFYVIMLLGLDGAAASGFLLVMFLASFVFYVPIGIIAAKLGKKRVLLAAFVLFILAALLMVSWGLIAMPPLLHGYLVMIMSALPIAIFGILPNAIIADVAEADGMRTGNHKAAIFFGARTLMQKIGTSITLLIFPFISTIGGDAATVVGVRATLLVGAAGLALGWWLFRKYDEAEVLKTLQGS